MKNSLQLSQKRRACPKACPQVVVDGGEHPYQNLPETTRTRKTSPQENVNYSKDSYIEFMHISG